MKFLLFFFTIITINYSKAQQLFNNSIEFNDGIYISAEEFANNKPSLKLEEVELNYNIEYISAQVKQLKIIHNEKDIADSVWGVCLNGKPYLRILPYIEKNIFFVAKDILKNNSFVKFFSFGEICILSIPIFKSHLDPVMFGVLVSAGAVYINTAPNESALRSNNSSDERNTLWYMYSVKLNISNRLQHNTLKWYMSNDSELSKQFENDRKSKKKLLYYVNKYNERNPFYIQPEN
jgi:hypothetical protein